MTHHYNGSASSHLCGPDNITSAWCGSATTVNSEGHNEGSAGPTTMPQQQQPLCCMPSQAYANCAMGYPLVSFTFRVESSKDFLCHVLVSVMVFAFCFQIPMSLPCSPLGGLNHWSVQHCNPLEYTLSRQLWPPDDCLWPIPGCTEWLHLPLSLVGGGYGYAFSCPQAIPFLPMGHTALGISNHLIPPPSLHGG